MSWRVLLNVIYVQAAEISRERVENLDPVIYTAAGSGQVTRVSKYFDFPYRLRKLLH